MHRFHCFETVLESRLVLTRLQSHSQSPAPIASIQVQILKTRSISITLDGREDDFVR